VTAVAAVLTAAGLATVDLDEELGGTRSADLLVCAGVSSKSSPPAARPRNHSSATSTGTSPPGHSYAPASQWTAAS
jgi:hypothetical protein